jgi:acyl-CoA thioester hydrolase
MPAPFIHRFRVRYHECDAQGIVFNANWLAYFDVTLTEWFRELFGSYGALVETGSDVVLAETTVRYRGSARFDDELTVAAGVERVGNTSMVVAFTARRGEEVLVEGRTVYVWVDAKTLAKQQIPAEVRDRLASYVTA